MSLLDYCCSGDDLVIDNEPTSSPSRDRRAGAAVVAWVLGAGILGGSWALHRVESSLDDEADKLAAVQQAQAQGATIDWDGRTANINPGSVDTHASREMVSALAGLAGVADVNLVEMAGPPTTVPSTTTTPTTAPTTTEVPPTTPTTIVPTTIVPTTTAPTTTEAPATTTGPTATSTSGSDGAAQLELLLADHSIEFLFSTAVPTPETEALLGELHDLLEANPTLSLHIVGHTDQVGNETANQLLSEARAQSIANHLIIRGIDASRMTTAGKGSTEPIADNATIEGQNRNRRVVIEVGASE